MDMPHSSGIRIMIDLLPVLTQATRTLQQNMTQWFSAYPPDMPWTVVSDYCIGDQNKNNDVFSFVVIANHDKTDNICEYIARVAPRDIKASKGIPLGLVQYLNLPVTFSVSFVLDRDSALLRRYAGLESMLAFIPDISEYVDMLRSNSPSELTYFDEVSVRLKSFRQDLSKPQVNEKLARQIHLAAAFAATMFDMVTSSTNPGYLRWITDRDALVERHDGIVFDLAYLYFLLLRSKEMASSKDGQDRMILDKPKFFFELPEKEGRHRFDELVRLPDYLAGTMADLDMKTLSFSREKFGTMLDEVFIDSMNSGVVHVFAKDADITVRSVQFRSGAT